MATGRVPTTANSPLTAKGDLFGYSTTQARVPVGNNGETLVADSSTSTGLRWQGNFAAGKNAIINGDFNINQRGLTTTSTDGVYGFDRFYFSGIDGTNSYSAQTFTPGSAPVTGYEATNFARLTSSGQTLSTAQTTLRQKIENVRTFAGRTVTVSFWAKANSGTPAIAVELLQNFGSGGSANVTGTISTKQTISTSWARYSYTGTVPSLSGKTIGASSFMELIIWVSAGSNFNARTSSLGIQSNTFDIWGVQVEAGDTATAFQTATGTLAGELAACQRYYYRSTQGLAFSAYGMGTGASSTIGAIPITHPVTMRVNPTSVDFGNLQISDYAGNSFAVTALALAVPGSQLTMLDATTGGTLILTRPYVLRNNNNTAGFLGFSAEL